MRAIAYSIWSVTALFALAAFWDDAVWKIEEVVENFIGSFGDDVTKYRGIPLSKKGADYAAGFKLFVYPGPKPTSFVVTHYSTTAEGKEKEVNLKLTETVSADLQNADTQFLSLSCFGRTSNISIAQGDQGNQLLLEGPAYVPGYLPFGHYPNAKIILFFVDEDLNSDQRLSCDDGLRIGIYDIHKKELRIVPDVLVTEGYFDTTRVSESQILIQNSFLDDVKPILLNVNDVSIIDLLPDIDSTVKTNLER